MLVLLLVGGVEWGEEADTDMEHVTHLQCAAAFVFTSATVPGGGVKGPGRGRGAHVPGIAANLCRGALHGEGQRI